MAGQSSVTDTIKFNIPDTGCNAGVCTIAPSSELPHIAAPVIIDGYSQPGAKANTLVVGNNAVLKIELSGADAPTNTSGLKIETANSTVQGLVVNNWENGVFLNVGATGNTVRGNFIGTDASGADPLGNNIGVALTNALNNTIGGTTAAARNIISGNGTWGVRITDAESTGNKVRGNYIGTDVSGNAALGNGLMSVSIQAGVANNTIGGTKASAGNIISGNGGDGVELFGSSSGTTGNRILSNSIYDNSELGIDLVHENNANEEVTPNDDGDGDVGPNNMQNFPVITSAKTGRRATTIKGTLNSTANTTSIIQFFSSPTADPSGFGEGKKFRGQKSVTTNDSGNATFTFKTKKKVPKGQFVTATATVTAVNPEAANQTKGDTSEFSHATTVS